MKGGHKDSRTETNVPLLALFGCSNTHKFRAGVNTRASIAPDNTEKSAPKCAFAHSFTGAWTVGQCVSPA